MTIIRYFVEVEGLLCRGTVLVRVRSMIHLQLEVRSVRLDDSESELDVRRIYSWRQPAAASLSPPSFWTSPGCSEVRNLATAITSAPVLKTKM